MWDDYQEPKIGKLESLCPCKSKFPYEKCCRPLHLGRQNPDTAEALMRSRYSAYFFRLVDYLVKSTHPDKRSPNLQRELEDMIHHPNWSYLTIIATAKGGKEDKVGKVEFVADYYVDGEKHALHEVSRFRRYKGVWKYLDGQS